MSKFVKILLGMAMAFPLYVAFIWHQHQPLYKSPAAGKYRLPWVRLHGIKDYLDSILLLERFPKLHQTVNLVPSLIAQLQDYIDGTALDPYLELTLTPAETLTPEQKRFAIERFFDANPHTMIAPYPRYAALFEQKSVHGDEWCLHHWEPQDYADLLAWHNLAWFDPLFQEEDAQVRAWFQQEKGFSLSDRQRIYSKQREILARILPQHRTMQDAGQLEVATTPYAHPILPLLADTQSARVAVPDMLLPGLRFRWEQDIDLHLQRARQCYERYFGRSPLGLWPSEQSVSPAILPHVARHGFRWLCSDEGVLGWSLGHYFHRDERGNLRHPHLLYQPYRLETLLGNLAIVFRDRRLSDAIGFSYSNLPAAEACRDLIGHLQAIHASYQQQGERDRPWLVTIALDGENCWEFYPRDGKPFLETLYAALSAEDSIKLVTVSEFIAAFPPTETIPPHQLHSGSWIDSSFTTWIGDPVKNRAWELLAEARRTLANHPEATLENNPEAWESLLAAEGSDWFWWFGEGHSSAHDRIFDRLFREHLISLYRALNESIPTALQYPLEPHDVPSRYRPERLIHPAIDGLLSEQDWKGAGRIEIAGARGTMHQATLVRRLWYGLDHFHFYLRLDFSQLPPRETLPMLHLLWFYPERTHYNSPIPLHAVPDVPPLNYLFRHHVAIDMARSTVTLQEATAEYGWQIIAHGVRLAFEHSLQLAVPWKDLDARPEAPMRLVLVLSKEGCYQTSLPEHAIIPIEVP